MSNNKFNVYSNDLIEMIQKSNIKLHDIKLKLDKDDLINQGLFLMATTFFEATLRDVMYKILISYPVKLKKDKFIIDKDILCNSNDYEICENIIENELFNLFKGNIKEQLLYITEITSNIKANNLINKPRNEDILNVIDKCSDISIYRNCLIHNAGIQGKDLYKKIKIYKHFVNKNVIQNINYDKKLIINFINDYLEFFRILEEKILKNVEFKRKTRIEQLRHLWSQCFGSAILLFDDYWDIDEEHDLVVDTKYPEWEKNISSSEKVYLSIWRHQFYDPIPTEEFLICSVNEDTLYNIYKGLEKVKFYHMHQEARYQRK